MKRWIAILSVALATMLSGHGLSAQHNIGVVGGFSFTGSNDHDANDGTKTRYHAGLTYQLKLPLGFSIQPSLVYHMKSASLKNVPGAQGHFWSSTGYVELPVSVQWGPDLVLFRPFLDVTPFVGYGVYAHMKSEAGASMKKWSETGLNRWEYGLGLGVGLEIWRFQIIGRYNWNFGNLADAGKIPGSDFGQVVKDAWKGRNYGGITLSIAFMFTSK